MKTFADHFWKGIDATKSERTNTHGEFSENSPISQGLKEILRTGRNWERLIPHQKEALEQIMSKIARIMAGDPNCPEHWHDVAGYARCVEERIGKKANPVPEPEHAPSRCKPKEAPVILPPISAGDWTPLEPGPTHTLKTFSTFFDAIWNGFKPFEIRKNDRNFKAGDILCLQETLCGIKTNRKIYAAVTYVFRANDWQQFGLEPGYCVLGLDLLARVSIPEPSELTAELEEVGE